MILKMLMTPALTSIGLKKDMSPLSKIKVAVDRPGLSLPLLLLKLYPKKEESLKVFPNSNLLTVPICMEIWDAMEVYTIVLLLMLLIME